jgi:sugar phosphate isomerase/epimerase
MHDAISINTLCLGAGGFEAHVETIARLGAVAVSPTREEIALFGVPPARIKLGDAGIAVATLTHGAFSFATMADGIAGRERLNKSIDMAAEIGAGTITMTTGARGTLGWTDASARFAAEIAPCATYAKQAGVRLSLEPTSHLYADVSIAHRLTDTVALAKSAGIGVGIDLFACWSDADVDVAIAEADGHTTLVQVSDYILGDRGLPCRAVPGDGVIPLDRLISSIVKNGFRGYFDLEIIGPRLEAEGIESGLARGADILGSLLRAAGFHAHGYSKT